MAFDPLASWRRPPPLKMRGPASTSGLIHATALALAIFGYPVFEFAIAPPSGTAQDVLSYGKSKTQGSTADASALALKKSDDGEQTTGGTDPDHDVPTDSQGTVGYTVEGDSPNPQKRAGRPNTTPLPPPAATAVPTRQGLPDGIPDGTSEKLASREIIVMVTLNPKDPDRFNGSKSGKTQIADSNGTADGQDERAQEAALVAAPPVAAQMAEAPPGQPVPSEGVPLQSLPAAGAAAQVARAPEARVEDARPETLRVAPVPTESARTLATRGTAQGVDEANASATRIEPPRVEAAAARLDPQAVEARKQDSEQITPSRLSPATVNPQGIAAARAPAADSTGMAAPTTQQAEARTPERKLGTLAVEPEPGPATPQAAVTDPDATRSVEVPREAPTGFAVDDTGRLASEPPRSGGMPAPTFELAKVIEQPGSGTANDPKHDPDNRIVQPLQGPDPELRSAAVDSRGSGLGASGTGPGRADKKEVSALTDSRLADGVDKDRPGTGIADAPAAAGPEVTKEVTDSAIEKSGQASAAVAPVTGPTDQPQPPRPVESLPGEATVPVPPRDGPADPTRIALLVESRPGKDPVDRPEIDGPSKSKAGADVTDRQAVPSPVESRVGTGEESRSADRRLNDLVLAVTGGDEAFARALLDPKEAVGTGVTEDPGKEQRLRILQEAAREGYSRAQYALARQYVIGETPQATMREAIDLLREAAESGDVDAQLLLGVIYAQGKIARRNLVEAQFYLALAAAQGVPDIDLIAKDLERDMTVEQIVATRNIGRKYRKLLQALNLPRAEGTNGDLLRDELLDAAAAGNSAVIARALARGADLTSKDSAGRTAVINAAWRGRMDAIELLVQVGANVDTRDDNGWSALSWAASNGHVDVVNRLVGAGADLNALAKDGTTALMRAAWNGHQVVVQSLLAAGADPAIKDKSGLTARDYATRSGNPALEAILR